MIVMSKYFQRISLVVLSALGSLPAFCQDSLAADKPEMAGLMRSNGKIYVVVTVLLIILAGLFLYLISTDRKISRLEKTGALEQKR
jgi:hypothetical protein